MDAPKGAQSRAVVLVFVALAALFAATASFAGAYRTERLSRAESHYSKGEQLARSGRAAEAAEEYRAALTFSPNDSRYRLALAQSLIDLGRLDEAEAHLIGLHDADPDNAFIDLLLARISSREGLTEQAVAQYHQAIYGLWPDNPVDNRVKARFELVSLLGRSGQSAQALAELMVLAHGAPDNGDVQLRLGSLLARYGSPQRAAETFVRLADREPANSAALTGAGDAFFAQGNYAQAARWYRKALHADPANAQARAGIEQVEEIQTLDPTLVSLPATMRYDRSRALLEKTLASLEACTDGRSPGPDLQAAIADANGLLARRRRRESDTPDGISLAEQIWQARIRLCGKPPAAEEALDLVMTKVAK